MNFKILVYRHYLSTDNVFLNSEESLVIAIKIFVAFLQSMPWSVIKNNKILN